MIKILILSGAVAATLLPGCLDAPDGDAVSKAASPIVQAGGVARLRSATTGDVTRVELLDEAGRPIGTLELVTVAAQHVRGKQLLAGHSLDVTWTDTEVTFARDGASPITLSAGAVGGPELEATLRDATAALNVATGVARDVGVFSPLQGEPNQITTTPLFLGTGTGNDSFTGYAWAWGTSNSSVQQAYYGSQNSAYNACQAVSSSCATWQGATMTTSCSSGSFTVSCSTTITPP